MKDFEDKLLKIIFNTSSGVISTTGYFIKLDNNFIVIKNTLDNKIHYFSMYSIKSITILGEISNEKK